MTDSPYSAPSADLEPPKDPSAVPMERPIEIKIAVGLLVFGIIFNWIIAFLTWDFLSTLQSLGPYLMGQVIGLLLASWIYYKIYQGRNWARIVYTVFAVPSMLTPLIPTVRAVLEAAPPISKLSSYVGYALVLVILWLLFFSPGRHWFKKR